MKKDNDTDMIAAAVGFATKSAHSKETEPAHTAVPVCLSSGCTGINLACTDHAAGAFPKGTMGHIVGDSHAGKTLLGLTMLAEAANDEAFDEYDLIHDDAENANLFDMKKLFGSKTAARVKPPTYEEDGAASHSSTIQEFQKNVMTRVKKGKPFIYMLDSFDSISSDEEQKKMEEKMKGKKTAGSYGMEKAKSAGQTLRMICKALARSKSILIIISQTRDNTDPMSFSTKTHSGGRALKFYATIQMWLAVVKKIPRTVDGRTRTIGVISQAKITKTKVTGKVREMEFPIYQDYGLDDITSSVNWLIKEGFWKKRKGVYVAERLGLEGTASRLVSLIERNGLISKLRKEMAVSWKVVEDSMKLNRKPRYT